MKDKSRVKMTLLLDSETIQLLRDYSYQETGTTNVSKAVMLMAKKYGNTRYEQLQKRDTGTAV